MQSPRVVIVIVATPSIKPEDGLIVTVFTSLEIFLTDTVESSVGAGSVTVKLADVVLQSTRFPFTAV
jgi:hypothetical protein